MALTSYFDSIGKVWRKAEREAYRAFHSPNSVHQADHFFNFCVTAHALRDYFLKYRAASDAVQNEYHDLWNGKPILVAVRDIANLSKHFVLRREPKTRGSRHTRSGIVDVYVDESGAIRLVPGDAPDIIIRLSDGSRYQLYEFTAAVLDFWKEFLRSKDIRVRRQSLEELRPTNG